MKTYIIYLLIPIALVLFSQTSPKTEVVGKKVQTYNIDSLKRENDSIKQQITKDTKVFKIQVDSTKKIIETYMLELKNIKIDTTSTPIDTLIETDKKKKNWLKRTIDRIKN